ncbi:heavy metal translocating P-type ATPase [Spirochaeta africana]|uniref:P-type Zn(2+) transporter n=1 Tax=Spirochaeta africana (strain ATCC 700263 / DSM 8902 / Z-7692) TaxID=889378 RepID=H9UL79_SPIAZ|nr:heavy metal translocating P-type ATPase [Spirochaeta africana]AFG38272.1 heavy metal-translocating P-type ATPase, Cd/Co/Hg/Pb/Zn-transporting [Spirochaeta africana DSM 8902]
MSEQFGYVSQAEPEDSGLSGADDGCGSSACSCSSAGSSPFAEPRAAHRPAHRVGRQGMLHLARIAGAIGLLGGAVLLQPMPAAWAGFVAAYLLVGGQVVWRAARSCLHGAVFDEMFLMSIATLGAFAIGEPAEAVAVMLFYSVGEFFQDTAVRRSRRSIAGLMDLRPDNARVLNAAGETELLPPEQVAVSSIIVVFPGERLPLDGLVEDGSGFLDTAALTGEAVPRRVGVGDPVSAGCISLDSRLRIRVTRRFSESSVARILALVQDAAERKSLTERFITRFARVYTPVVVALAAAVAVLPPLLAGGDWYTWLYRALVVLVISCPCALVVSIPLSYFAGIGGAARRRVLVKGANYLDTLNDLHTLVLDKTGTLTCGVFAVHRVAPAPGWSREALLETAAHAESSSSHPIAVSVRAAWGGAIQVDRVTEVREESGHGITARVDGRMVLVGSERLMQRAGIPCQSCPHPGSVVHIAAGGRYAGWLVVSDRVRTEAAMALQRLRRLGIRRIAMLTGDTDAAAREIAGQLGIEEIYSQLLPEDKVAITEDLQRQLPPGGRLGFVGDGINDAPVLMRADVGMAMGGLGSDAAIEAADVVLMDDSLLRVPAALEAAGRTRRIVRQNIVFTLLAKLVFITLGAVGLAGMWAAIIGDVGVSLLAVLNAVRALGRPQALAD